MKSEIITIPQGFYAAGTEVELRHKPGQLKEFTSTPEGVHCPHFWRLAVGNLCRFECSYCYLQLTFWRSNVHRPVLYMDRNGMQDVTRRWMMAHKEPLVLNIGELSDSLDFDDYTRHSEWLVPLFESPVYNLSGHKLLFLTKSSNVSSLVRHAETWHGPNGKCQLRNTIVSWSINAPIVASEYEGRSAAVHLRLAAALRAQEAGYRIRLRIDPIIPINFWPGHYIELVALIDKMGVRPERFTLGSLRMLPGLDRQIVKNDRNRSVVNFTADQDDPDRRRRIPEEQRVNMYVAVAEALHAHFPEAPIGVCKETTAVRAAITNTGYDVDHDLCNCTL